MKRFTEILIYLIALLTLQEVCFGQDRVITLDSILIPVAEANKNGIDSTYSEFQFSVVPFIGTNGKYGSAATVDYSFNLFGGYNRNIRKAEFGGLFNADLGNVQWVQYAGIANIVLQNSTGVQAAGCANLVNGSLKGVQISGIGNLVNGAMDGVQYSGVFNINRKKVNGIQASGIININGDSLMGLQLAGIINNNLGTTKGIAISGLVNNHLKKFTGTQISGFSNCAIQGIDGAQIAGFVNVSNNITNGTQIAGFINVANKINGSQIGVFNFSDSITGIPIGFFSFTRKGYHKLEISSNELFYLNASFITGVNAFHNIFTIGIRPDNTSHPLWTFGYGVGTAIPLSKRVSLNIDITSNQISKEKFIDEINLLNKGFVGVDIKLAKKLALTTGPELNAYFTNTKYKDYPNLFTEVKPNIFYRDEIKKSDIAIKMWVGWKLGLRFF